jgi:predicted kinase
VRHWALENFDELQAGPAARSHAPRLKALRGWTESEFAHLAPLLARRHAEGFVRECHGDLHLANIVLVDSEPLLFDCLEFNPSLRHIDLIADLAFLYMDLRRRSLPALAWRLVNAWAEHTGDYQGLCALRFFAVYRAVVRAKVALLRADQHDAQAWSAFERDFALAEALAAPRRGPLQLVVTSGLSGSGKSTVAQLLVDTLGAIRVRSDVERKRLFGLAAQARPVGDEAEALYGRAATIRTYARLQELATLLLAGGLHTIADAAFLHRSERDAMRAVAAAAGARLTLIECTAPLDVLRERVRRRSVDNRDASDADLGVLEQQLRSCEPVQDDEQAQRLPTDTDRDTLRVRALEAIGAPGFA